MLAKRQAILSYEYPMNRKLYLDLKSMLETMKSRKVFVVVVGSLAIFGLIMASGTFQHVSQGKLASFQSISITPTTIRVDVTVGWRVYTDPYLGFSFKYPPDWKITPDGKPGQDVTLINPNSPYYRGIELSIEDNPKQLAASDFILAGLSEAHNGKLPSTVYDEPFKATNISGTKIAGLPPTEGVLTIFVANHKEKILRCSLIEGGAVGGADTSSFPTAQEDEKIFFQILNTLKFSS
jgi:hypothetical protein